MAKKKGHGRPARRQPLPPSAFAIGLASPAPQEKYRLWRWQYDAAGDCAIALLDLAISDHHANGQITWRTVEKIERAVAVFARSEAALRGFWDSLLRTILPHITHEQIAAARAMRDEKAREFVEIDRREWQDKADEAAARKAAKAA